MDVEYGKTGDWTEFTTIRQDVILKIAEIVETSGTQFAAPTQLAYLARDKGIDVEYANAFAGPGAEPRANDVFRFPGEARTGTE
jgi:MscS family membrane protein